MCITLAVMTSTRIAYWEVNQMVIGPLIHALVLVNQVSCANFSQRGWSSTLDFTTVDMKMVHIAVLVCFCSTACTRARECGHFVNKPFKSWIKMSHKANVHAKLHYHLTATSQMSDFLAWYENPSLTITTILDNESQEIMDSNQKVAESSLKIVMLCGKQGLYLRGHRDNILRWNDQDDTSSNEGNFVELVWFQAETNLLLAQHLAKAPQNSQYTLKTIQNDMVEVMVWPFAMTSW